MTITVLGSDGNPFDQNSVELIAGRKLRTVMKLKFTNNYATGGDTLDLTNGGGTVLAPTCIPAAESRGAESVEALARGPAGSQSAGGGYYAVVAPNGDTPLTQADLANLKLKIFSSGGAELGAGAYPAAVMNDVVLLEAIYLR